MCAYVCSSVQLQMCTCVCIQEYTYVYSNVQVHVLTFVWRLEYPLRKHLEECCPPPLRQGLSLACN